MEYREIHKHKIEFIYHNIPLGTIISVDDNHKVEYYHWDNESKLSDFLGRSRNFNTLEAAKRYVENRAEESWNLRDPNLFSKPVEEMIVEESRIRVLKELVYKLATKQNLDAWEVELVLSVGKELGDVLDVPDDYSPACPKCGSDRIRPIAEGIVWCNNCEEHQEVRVMGQEVKLMSRVGESESIVFIKTSETIHRVERDGVVVGKIKKFIYNGGNAMYTACLPGGDTGFTGPDAFKMAKEHVIKELGC